jgi:apolipoprotein D and lipocalin family protein
MRHLRTLVLCCPLLLLAACTSVPDGITPVSHFQLDRYLGKWYEIARLDHSFERGLSDVSAEYRLQADGSVEVINRGYNAEKSAWKEAVGKAQFIGDPTLGSLKVSFFGPFYGGYHVAALDERDYRWSLVVGPSRDYLWILARERHLPADVRQQLLEKASQLGFDISKLIWVSQDRPDA